MVDKKKNPSSVKLQVKRIVGRAKNTLTRGERQEAIINDLLKNNHIIREELQHSKNHRDELNKVIEQLKTAIVKNDERISDVVHRVSTIPTSIEPGQISTLKSSSSTKLLADNHLLDSFYVKFENSFRGTEENIQSRQKAYLPYFNDLKKNSQQKPVLDIGCGRGEFIDLLTSNGIKAVGLDLNISMVEKVINKGGEAYNIDALTYLRKQKSNSITAITGFHIVEHIPFDQLLDIFNECYRVLVPGGFTLFETPNPENIIVSTHNFYMDPSHLHPIPPALLEFTMSSCGFTQTEVKRLHPLNEEILKNKKDKALDEIYTRFYGAQDYAVIAYK